MYDSSAKRVAEQEISLDKVTSLTFAESIGNKRWLLKTILSRATNHTSKWLSMEKMMAISITSVLKHWIETLLIFNDFFHRKSDKKKFNLNKKMKYYFSNVSISQNLHKLDKIDKIWRTADSFIRRHCYHDSISYLMLVSHLGSAILDPPSWILRHDFSNAKCNDRI